MVMKMWEIQIFLEGEWVCLYGHDTTVLQFPTQTEAKELLDEIVKDLEQAIEDGHITRDDSQFHRVKEVDKAPMFAPGHRFKLPGYKHMSATDLEMIISYRYQNDTTYRYHCGLIIGKEGDAVPEMYRKRCNINNKFGVIYVDYCTSDEQEIVRESL